MSWPWPGGLLSYTNLLNGTRHELGASPSPAAWCLFLDVDGTLLEIAPTPDAVHVDSGLPPLLERVARSLGGAVALVSGRSLETLDRLFAPRHWPAAGLHGIERRGYDGSLHLAGPPAETLDAARRSLSAFADRSPGLLFEDKGRSVALHYRGAPGLESDARREIERVAQEIGTGYAVLEGNCVFELRPTDANKADAIRAFLAETPFAGRRPMFIGDDITDLAGFAAVERAGGVSVAVGDRVQAMSRVASPRDVQALLADLAEQRVTTQ